MSDGGQVEGKKSFWEMSSVKILLRKSVVLGTKCRKRPQTHNNSLTF